MALFLSFAVTALAISPVFALAGWFARPALEPVRVRVHANRAFRH